MTNKPVLVDLFCGQGGCTRGYQRAGFYVIGVDIHPQPRYIGDEFYQMDALEFLREYQGKVAAYSASPPCQAYSSTRTIRGNEHPDLVAATRAALQATCKPYVIENVKGAPLIEPIMLVGSMFGLRTMRPRLFECSFPVPFALAPPPAARHADMGRRPKHGEYMHVVGNFSDVDYARSVMGCDWMSQYGLAQAIPPAYTEYIGRYLLEATREVITA